MPSPKFVILTTFWLWHLSPKTQTIAAEAELKHHRLTERWQFHLLWWLLTFVDSSRRYLLSFFKQRGMLRIGTLAASVEAGAPVAPSVVKQ